MNEQNIAKQKILTYAESFRDIARSFYEEEPKEESPFLGIDKTEDRTTYLYQRTITENQKMMAEHLNEMAQMMTEAAKLSFSYTPFPERKAKQFMRLLKVEGILLKEMYYIGGDGSRRQIGASIAMEKRCSHTIEEVADMLSVLLNIRLKVSKITDYFLDREYRDFRFLEEPRYVILSGAAKAVKESETVSGDNYSIFEDENGTITVLLSDGMGSGEKACQDSERVLDLMERMLEAGFTRHTALQIVNNSLVLSGGENNMSTLDIGVLDLYEGTCELTKVGAAGSYIKRDHMVEQISTRTLPLGVFSHLETESIKRRIVDGDYLIMVSDGVTDGLSQGIGEEALPEVLSRLELENPKEMANYILNYVIHQSKGNIRDDMTVLVVGIWENTIHR